MTISNAEFQVWLRDPSARRVVLLEAQSWYQGGASTRYASDRGYRTVASDTPANTNYPARIRAIPNFSITMSEQLRGVTEPARGQIVMDNTDGNLDSYLLHAWDGREFTLFIGDATWARADFRTILSGVIEDITVPDRAQIALTIRDLRSVLDQPLTSSTITLDQNINKRKPVCYGHCYNVTPVLVDEANKKYAVHDGAIEDIPDVRVDGVTVTFSEQLTDGTFTLTSAATGTVTADVKGAKVSSVWLTKTADIIQDIAINRCGLLAADLHTASFTALNTAQAGTIGLYVQEGSMSCLEAIDALTLGAGGWSGFDRSGKLRVGIISAPAAQVAEVTRADMYKNSFRVLRRMIPRAAVRLGYKRRWTVQSSLATSVTGDTRVMYQTPYDIKEATNSIPQHLLAGNNDEIDATLFEDGTVCQTEATRRAALAAEIRYLFEVTVAVGAVNVQLGDTVRIIHDRYGFASPGKLAVVVGIEENPAARYTKIVCWR